MSSAFIAQTIPNDSLRFAANATNNSTKVLPHQWSRESHAILDGARRIQTLSSRQRDGANVVQSLTQDRVVTDAYVSGEALRAKLDDSHALKSRAEMELDAVNLEIAELTAEAERAEQVHELMKEPLAIAEECLNIRKRRPLREQTRDAVERALNEQAAAARHALRMLSGVIEACHNELGRLREIRERLEEDIEQKNVTLEVDNEALTMQAGWTGHERIARSQHLPHVWRQRTESICADGERVRATARRLREKSAVVQSDSFSTERQTRNQVLRALQKKIEDTSRLKSELEAGLENTVLEIQNLEDAKKSVELSIEEKHEPLALARSRLQVRLSRPTAEQVRDEAERSLEREVADLENSIALLHTEMLRLNADIAQLEKQRGRIELDLKDKIEALGLECECENREMELAIRLG